MTDYELINNVATGLYVDIDRLHREMEELKKRLGQVEQRVEDHAGQVDHSEPMGIPYE